MIYFFPGEKSRCIEEVERTVKLKGAAYNSTQKKKISAYPSQLGEQLANGIHPHDSIAAPRLSKKTT
jgi:hypothetical protein